MYNVAYFRFTDIVLHDIHYTHPMHLHSLPLVIVILLICKVMFTKCVNLFINWSDYIDEQT